MQQSTALDILKTGNNVFITGAPGTGKTYLLSEYISFLKASKIDFAFVAPTGIAASHINGKTIHSFFGFGLRNEFDEMYIDEISQNKFIYNRIKSLKVLVIDEVSMVSTEIFAAMNSTLQCIKQNSLPFGGVQVVISGDFFQLPPVNRGQQKSFVYQTKDWDDLDLKVSYLEKSFRQESGDEISVILAEMRQNSLSRKSIDCLHSSRDNEAEGKFRATRLYTHNEDVDRINLTELGKLDGELHIFKSKSKGGKDDIDRIYNTSLVSKELHLKVGAIVIFIRNNFERGYINGTTGIVREFDKETKLPIVEIFSGRKISVRDEVWTREKSGGVMSAEVNQLPLRLAWAITVHKSQGMTIEYAEIDLSKSFEKGQGYVAISRLKSIKGLRVLGMNQRALEVDGGVLEKDVSFQESSKKIEEVFKKIERKDIEMLSDTFVTFCGGEKGAKESSPIHKKSTYEMTLDLVEQKCSISEIAKKREIAMQTVVNHLAYIKKHHPGVSLDRYIPSQSTMDGVSDAYSSLKKRESNFTSKGEIKISAIHNFLSGKVTYVDISLALIFTKSKSKTN